MAEYLVFRPKCPFCQYKAYSTSTMPDGRSKCTCYRCHYTFYVVPLVEQAAEFEVLHDITFHKSMLAGLSDNTVARKSLRTMLADGHVLVMWEGGVDIQAAINRGLGEGIVYHFESFADAVLPMLQVWEEMQDARV